MVHEGYSATAQLKEQVCWCVLHCSGLALTARLSPCLTGRQLQSVFVLRGKSKGPWMVTVVHGVHRGLTNDFVCCWVFHCCCYLYHAVALLLIGYMYYVRNIFLSDLPSSCIVVNVHSLSFLWCYIWLKEYIYIYTLYICMFNLYLMKKMFEKKSAAVKTIVHSRHTDTNGKRYMDKIRYQQTEGSGPEGCISTI